jgi:hypothetical protein
MNVCCISTSVHPFGARPLGAITQFDIQSVYAQMFNRGLSPRTIEYTEAPGKLRLGRPADRSQIFQRRCVADSHNAMVDTSYDTSVIEVRQVGPRINDDKK